MIEKILEKLEELRSVDICTGITCDECEKICGKGDCAKNYQFLTINKVKAIVQEVAKDGGWIPCSERLPEESELVLIYAESTARGGSIRCVAELRNGFWFAQIASDTLGLTGIGQFKVIAWQPLPQPYQKGE